MRLTVRARNGTVPVALKEYAEKKVRKLERYFHHMGEAVLLQATERGQHIVELSVEGDGVLLRSEERCNDLHAAVDNVVEKLERQITRFKMRIRRGHQRPGRGRTEATGRHADLAAAIGAEEEGEESFVPRIARRKRFPMKPMSGEEAARQMELLAHNFFLFLNEETGEVNVLYRRRDGDYGLIEPER